ncbi:MAG: alpha/beta hydrolase fold domain-containing protein [Dyadobacter sp.]
MKVTNAKIRENDTAMAPFGFRNVTQYYLNRTTRTVRYDGYTFNLTIIKPLRKRSDKGLLPAFLFIPDMSYRKGCHKLREQAASTIAVASGQVALIVDLLPQNEICIPIFEFFATLRWLTIHGKEIGITGEKIAVIGFQLGANVATVLSLMVLNDKCSRISVQILIDPQFYVTRISNAPGSLAKRPGDYDAWKKNKDWLDMGQIFNLPLESKIRELSGLPPTLVQLSQDKGFCCDLEYYCTKLVHAGNEVTYINYNEHDDSSDENDLLNLKENLIMHTAVELRKFG